MARAPRVVLPETIGTTWRVESAAGLDNSGRSVLKRVLLTGGLGYIGSHTTLVLAEAGYEVVLYDNLSNSKRSVLDRLEIITKTRLPFVKGDVRDTILLQETLRSYRIDVVIHFAGLKAVGESVERPLAYYENNVAGTVSLVSAMRSVGLETLIFSSSATVYGDPVYVPIDESHPTLATNPYGRTKLHIEEMLADLVQSNDNWAIACLRYFNPVGAHKSALIGEDPNGIPNNLLPYVVQVADGSFPILNIYGDDYDTPDGTGIRDYIHVMDLAEGHRAALQFLHNKKGWYTFNLGAGKGFSVLDIVRAFEAVSGRRVPYRIVSRRSGDVAQCLADPAKAEALLDWCCVRDLDEICGSAWAFQIHKNDGKHTDLKNI